MESQYFQPYPVTPRQPAVSYPSAPPQYSTNGLLYPAIDSVNATQFNPAVPTQVVYPSLSDYMGLELTPEVIAANMPDYIGTVAVQPPVSWALLVNIIIS